MVEALAAGPVVGERYDAAIQSFVPFFSSGREGQPPRSRGSPRRSSPWRRPASAAV
jgi:hypothetical protein